MGRGARNSNQKCIDTASLVGRQICINLYSHIIAYRNTCVALVKAGSHASSDIVDCSRLRLFSSQNLRVVPISVADVGEKRDNLGWYSGIITPLLFWRFYFFESRPLKISISRAPRHLLVIYAPTSYYANNAYIIRLSTYHLCCYTVIFLYIFIIIWLYVLQDRYDIKYCFKKRFSRRKFLTRAYVL